MFAGINRDAANNSTADMTGDVSSSSGGGSDDGSSSTTTSGQNRVDPRTGSGSGKGAAHESGSGKDQDLTEKEIPKNIGKSKEVKGTLDDEEGQNSQEEKSKTEKQKEIIGTSIVWIYIAWSCELLYIEEQTKICITFYTYNSAYKHNTAQ